MQRVFVLAVSLLIFLFSFSFFSFGTYAEEGVSVSSNLKENINYELPYPGLLPDNPLYFLRAARDRIVSFLIADPKKKAEFNLLQADKRLNAGIYLFDKGKVDLSASTISKAENYFEEALSKLDEARLQGERISEIEGRLMGALGKHKQELELLTKKASVNFKQNFEKERKRLTDFQKRLSR